MTPRTPGGSRSIVSPPVLRSTIRESSRLHARAWSRQEHRHARLDLRRFEGECGDAMSTSEAPELPIKGTITSWTPDDSIGRIRLSSGEEIRFGHSACVGLRPSVGAEVWVVEVAPHPLG